MTENNNTYINYYIPGKRQIENSPLDRYLPPNFRGVVSHWLSRRIPQKGIIIDPFGNDPFPPLEAALNGYRVIVASNNPVTRFVLEILINGIKKSEYLAALAKLASLQVGLDRLESHIKFLYETTCSICNKNIQAEMFLWRRGEDAPYGKLYDCPICGKSSIVPTNLDDRNKAKKYSKLGLHRARALERVAPLHDPDRTHAEEALDVYLPRSTYALITIINKLSSIPSSDPSHRLLEAMLLLTFDRASTLWPYPKKHQRPKLLTVPSQFREYNIWTALETSIDLWGNPSTSVQLTKWPELPADEGGICIFEGRIKDLASILPKAEISCLLTTFPRPNQAFWALSALWSGWLWGYEAVQHFKTVLRRRRYDWGWHTTAIKNALLELSLEIPPGTPFLGLIKEIEPGFITSVILGVQLANFKFINLSLRKEDHQAQITCQQDLSLAETHGEHKTFFEVIKKASREYLEDQRGEPSPFIYLHGAGLVALANNSLVRDEVSASDYYNEIQGAFKQALSYRNGFLRYGGSEKSYEIGNWWIKDPKIKMMPLTDRLEQCLVKHLLKFPASSFHQIDASICEKFSGLTPPISEFLQVGLNSYGVEIPIDSDRWFLKEGDETTKRRKDIQTIISFLSNIGSRLGYKIHHTQSPYHTVHWNGLSNYPDYTFKITASALLGNLINSINPSGSYQFLVVPGSRANLVAYKLKNNNYLQHSIQDKISFIKYRHVHQLNSNPHLSMENIYSQLSLDPLTYSKPQIRLF